MKDHKYYLYIIAGLILLISFIIYTDPEQDNSENETHLWEEKWSAVEYGDMRFEKEKKFNDDEYYVIKKDKNSDKSNAAPADRRKGSYVVANIFNSWDKPVLSGSYDSSMLSSIKGEEIEHKEIKFYSRLNDKNPVKIVVLKRMPDGRTVLRSDYNSHSGKIYILKQEYFSSFDQPLKQYRERRLFIFPSDSYTENVEVKLFQESSERTLLLNQNRIKTETDLIQQWTDSSSAEIPLQLATGFDGFLRQMQISKFSDEEKESEENIKNWNLPGETSQIKLKMKFADTIEIQIKRIELTGNEMVLVKHDEFIDQMDQVQWNKFKMSAIRIIDYIKTNPGKKSGTISEPSGKK